MLHIIFLILKIIGVILLAILGLLVLLIFVFLFTAVKYEGKGSCSGTLQTLDADLKFHWLFHLIRGHVTYRNEELYYQIKAAWKTLASSESEVKATEDAKTVKASETPPEPEQKPVMTAQSIPEEDKPPSAVSTPPDVETETSAIAQTVSEDTKQKIKYTFQKICDNIKRLIETKDKFVEFLTDEAHKNAWGRLLKELKRILRRLNPKQLELDLHFGFDDPALTGKTLAFCGMLYPFIVHHVRLRPDFEQSIIEGEGRIKGGIRPAYFVSTALHLLLDKNVRMTYKDIKNLR